MMNDEWRIRKPGRVIMHTAEDIMRRAVVCRLALSDERQPYIVPLCFGYEDNALYFHSAPQGRKLEMLAKNARVCFEMEVDVEFVPADKACQWSVKYRSVVGFGKAQLVEAPEAKRHALAVIVKQYSQAPFALADKEVARAVVIKVEIEQISVKQHGYTD